MGRTAANPRPACIRPAKDRPLTLGCRLPISTTCQWGENGASFGINIIFKNIFRTFSAHIMCLQDRYSRRLDPPSAAQCLPTLQDILDTDRREIETIRARGGASEGERLQGKYLFIYFLLQNISKHF